MAFVFPLTTAQFFAKLRVREVDISISEPREIDRTASGTILSASIGDPVWRGEIRLRNDGVFPAVFELEALISVLNRAGSSFLMYDPRRKYPAADPAGSIIAGQSPTIGSISANRREISIASLSVGYTITPGDLLSFSYGSNPVRYALHRAVTGASVAPGTTETGAFEVTPMIRQGASVGAAIQLVAPAFKAVLLPDPSYGAGRPAVIPGARFGFVQTLR